MWRRLSLLVITCLSLLALAPTSALAHHASVTATVDCNGLVTYSATSWTTGDSGINKTAAVTINGVSVASGGFTAANGYALTGTYQLTAPFGSPSATVTWGLFGENEDLGSAGSATTGPLTVPACPIPPAQPGGSIGDVVCASGGALATLTNTGGEAATIRLTYGATTEDVVVQGGATVTRLVPVAEDTSVVVTISSGGTTIVTREVHANCVLAPAVPAAVIGDLDCAQGGAIATLTNTGQATATFTVLVNGTTIASIPVLGGATTPTLVPITENTSATITVSAATMTDVTRVIMRDCIAPAAPAATVGAVSCVEGGAFVTLRNTGGEFATFTVAVDGVTIDTVTVGGGATGYRLVPIAEDRTALITVSAALMAPVVTSVGRDCAPAAADATPAVATPVAAAVGGPDDTDVRPVAVAGVSEEDDGDEAVLAAATTGGTGDALPFTGETGTRALVLGALLALLMGTMLPISARVSERARARRR
ncbi:MAG: hypothetical protein JWM25_111 [Thermoleophilia bacterium]|nr:hypothetical protein [Thermoleophilia bacterium]